MYRPIRQKTMNTEDLVAWILEQQQITDSTNQDMYNAAVFMLAMYALELDMDLNDTQQHVLEMIAQIAVARVQEYNLQNPLNAQ
jgi:hypothetical protein